MKEKLNIIFSSIFLKHSGAWTTIVLSFILLAYFYGNILFAPNIYYFGASGDGMQTYFSILYHIKHDPNLWHFNGMNYPYGEQVFFTGCMPLISNIIQVLKPLVDLSPYAVGIVNLTMLSSIVFCALFLYLIFKKIGIYTWLAIFSAVGIAFLSPQIHRMGGHYSLALPCILPMAIWFAIRFFEKPTLKLSLWMFFLAFFAASMHFYLFFMVAVIYGGSFLVCFYHAYHLKIERWKLLSFAAIQIILPFIVIQSIQLYANSYTDRTENPWGFLVFVSNISGIFQTENHFYASWVNAVHSPVFPDWEGRSYVGILGLLAFILLILFSLRKLVRFKISTLLAPTSNPVLNVLCWLSLLVLLFSFGLPFKFEWGRPYLDKIGILKQFRGVGRFAWLFFYVINILAIYFLQLFIQKQQRLLTQFFVASPILLLAYDAYKHNVGQEIFFQNRYTQLEDKNNSSSDNAWIKDLNTSDYQAILPLPYTHIGSENIWITNETDIQNQAYILSLKTGLPLISVSMSRTSLSQTFKSYQLIQEAFRYPAYLNDLPSKKNILILVKKDALLPHEQALIENATFILENKKYLVYKISIAELKNRNPYQKVKKEFKNATLYKTNTNWLCDTPEKVQVLHSFAKSKKPLQLQTFTVVQEGSVEAFATDSLTFSCWISNFTEDLVPRTSFEIQFFDSEGKPGTYVYQQFKDGFKALDGNRALIEFPVILKPSDVRFKITCWNENLLSKQKTVFLSNLLIKNTHANLYWWDEKQSEITKNNRTYFPKWN